MRSRRRPSLEPALACSAFGMPTTAILRIEKFLVTCGVRIRRTPDPFSDYRAGFEIRTHRALPDHQGLHPHRGWNDAQRSRVRASPTHTDLHNGVSLLQQMDIIGYRRCEAMPTEDDAHGSSHPKQLPPLTFGYTQLRTEEAAGSRSSSAVTCPRAPWARADMELVDLHGSGLPDILEMNGTVRYWRNLGNGRFDMPRPMREAPPHALADPGVQMIDANGDGRMDLLVTSGPLAGYYPLTHSAAWDRKSFQRYDARAELQPRRPGGPADRPGRRRRHRRAALRQPPGVLLQRSRHAMAWQRTRFAAATKRWSDIPQRQFLRPARQAGRHDRRRPAGHRARSRRQRRVLAQPRPRPLGQAHLHAPWPALRLTATTRGASCSATSTATASPTSSTSTTTRCMLWINQSGNGWSEEPIVIDGTPPVTDMDDVRLVDLHGTGVSGVLWSSDATGLSRAPT